MYISLILCSHNPNFDYLEKTIVSLKAQTLSTDKWEFILVDNASKEFISNKVQLNWHSNSRHIREEKLGLTQARLCGIQAAVGEILVFVDDDNILETDYLQVVEQIGRDYPFIGAWGGCIQPQFEETPPEWIKPYLSMLAIRQFDKDKWSNLPTPYETAPCGAGMCIRKVVAEKYIEYINQDPLRLRLGRTGQNLTSCEDSDIALTSCDIGLGTGQFTVLKMSHIIPKSRYQEEYLIKLQENFVFSQTILQKIRKQPMPQKSLKESIKNVGRQILMNSRERRFYQARQRGIDRALEYLSQSNK